MAMLLGVMMNAIAGFGMITIIANPDQRDLDAVDPELLQQRLGEVDLLFRGK